MSERWSEVWYIQTVRSKQWRYSTYQSVTGPDINTEYRNKIVIQVKDAQFGIFYNNENYYYFYWQQDDSDIQSLLRVNPNKED